MKIYNRQDFMKLPEGVLYSKGQPWFFDGLSIKGETLTNDFLELGLLSIDADDSGQWNKRLDEMLENGVSYPMADSYGRDGCFDEKDIFLVFERSDLEKLKEYVNTAIDVLK